MSIPYDFLRKNPKDYVIYVPSLDPLFLMASEPHRNFRQWLVAQQEEGSILILEASSQRHNSLKLLAKNQEDYLYGFFINSLFQHTQHYQILEQREELLPLVSLQKIRLEEKFSVTIDGSAVETACLLSEQLPYDTLYTFELAQPLKTLLLLEDACVFQDGEESSNGEDTVKQIQRETVLSLVEYKFGEKYLNEITQSQEEKTSVLDLPERLSRVIIGQKEAITPFHKP